MINKTKIKKNLNGLFGRTHYGSVLAEAALVIPILIGVTLFTIEFGRVIYITNSINQVARSTARIASVTTSYTTSQLINSSGAMNLLPDVSRLTLTITPAPGSARTIGTRITVTAQYNYNPIVNPFGILNSGSPWAPVIKSTSVTLSEVSSAS